MTEKNKNIIAFSFVLVGIVFVALGVWRGENESVLRKAVNICLECIGIG